MIKHIITGGLGNGTFSGDIDKIVTRGLSPSPPLVEDNFYIEVEIKTSDLVDLGITTQLDVTLVR